MQRAFRSFLVGVMIAMMSFDPATACHFLHGGWGGGYGGGYCGYGGYYGSCGSSYSYSTPVYYGGYRSCNSCGYSTVVYDSSYCGGCSSGCSDCGSSGCSGCDSGCGDCGSGCSDCGSGCSDCGSTVSEGTVIEGTVIEGTVIENGPTMVNEQPTMQPMAPAPPADMKPAMPLRPAPAPLPSTVNRPAETMPAPSMPADTKPPVVPPQTVETPPAVVTPPQATPATPPATPPASNDLFGAPAEEPAKPAAESSDSLFGPTTPETPATPPAAAPSTAPATPPSEPNSDLFGPASTDGSAPATPPQDSTMPPAATEPPADGTTPPAEKKEETDNLFGGLEQILREPGGLASEEMRLWVDSTGQFTCRGRLVRFLDGQVRLMKDNGRTTTVALYRLSQNDLEFINRQASAQRSEGIERTAQVDVTPAVAAN